MTQATIHSIDCTLNHTTQREAISPAPSAWNIEVPGDIFTNNPSYPINVATYDINTSPSHNYLHNNSLTDIINSISIDVTDNIVHTNPS